MMADKLGISIGDTVTIDIGGTESDYIVTALFQSIAHTGLIGRVYQTLFRVAKFMTHVDL